MEQGHFTEGSTVAVLADAGHYVGIKRRQVRRVTKTFVELDDGSRWTPNGSSPYLRSRVGRWDRRHFVEPWSKTHDHALYLQALKHKCSVPHNIVERVWSCTDSNALMALAAALEPFQQSKKTE